jgi:hypothetical protein
LRAVDRALQDPSIPLLESEIGQDASVFGKHWAHFRYFIKARLEVKAAFDEVVAVSIKSGVKVSNFVLHATY